jgi:hypothetical protein
METLRPQIASATSRKGSVAGCRRGALRILAMLLSGAIAQAVIANITFAQIGPLVEVTKSRFALSIKSVIILNDTRYDDPLSMHFNINNFITRERHLGANFKNLSIIRGDSHVPGHHLIKSTDGLGGAGAWNDLGERDHLDPICRSRSHILDDDSNVGKKTFFPIKHAPSLYTNVSAQLPFGSLLREASLIASGYRGIAGREGGDSCEYQGGNDKQQANSSHPQLQVGIIGGTFGGSRHALLFAQIGLVMILSIAAWGPIYLGIRFLAFGNPRIPSDYILTPRFLIGWSYPRLVGVSALCCGLLLIGSSVWFAWLLRE